jgi:hypothetical protein
LRRREMKKSPRDIVVKALFSADEFLEFDRECVIADVSHSRLLRSLALAWCKQQMKYRRVEKPKEGAPQGPKVAIFRPKSRVNYGTAPVHLRV